MIAALNKIYNEAKKIMVNRGKISLFIIIFSLISNIAEGQYWNTKSFEGIFGIGVSNLIADIGSPIPANAGMVGQYFWIIPQSFRPVLFGGGRYILSEKMAFKFNLIASNLSAADIYSDNNTRNLIANVYLFEISGQFEYYVIKEKRKMNVYRLKSYKWYKNISLPSYFFIGVGESFFFSKAIINERYINETGFSTKYNRQKSKYTTPVIPFGIGIKLRLNREIRFGIEAGYRFAFSDYLDEKTADHDKWPDSYQFILFSLNYKLRKGRNGLPVIRRR